MVRNRWHRVRKDANGVPCVDQGEIHGFPVTYNPDDDRFYIHEPGTTDGTNVIVARQDWRNIVQCARKLRKERDGH